MYFIPNLRLSDKEKITKLKHGELSEDEVYKWIEKIILTRKL